MPDTGRDGAAPVESADSGRVRHGVLEGFLRPRRGPGTHRARWMSSGRRVRRDRRGPTRSPQHEGRLTGSRPCGAAPAPAVSAARHPAQRGPRHDGNAPDPDSPPAGSPQTTAASTTSAPSWRPPPTCPSTRTPTRCGRTSSSTATGCAPQVGTPQGRRAVQAELARALVDGPGRRGLRRRLPGHRRRRPGDGRLRGDDRRAEGGRRGRRGPLRQARQPTTASGVRWTSSPSATRRPSRTTTATTSSPWSPRPGWVAATSSPARSTWSTRAVRRRSRTATTTWASCPRSRASPTPPTCTRCPRT